VDKLTWTAATCGCTDTSTTTYCTADNTCKLTATSDDSCCNGTDRLCKGENLCKTAASWTTACGCTLPTETLCSLDTTCKDTGSTDTAGCCVTGNKLCRYTNLCVLAAAWTDTGCGCDLANETLCTALSVCMPTADVDDSCCTGSDKLCKDINTCVVESAWNGGTCGCPL